MSLRDFTREVVHRVLGKQMTIDHDGQIYAHSHRGRRAASGSRASLHVSMRQNMSLMAAFFCTVCPIGGAELPDFYSAEATSRLIDLIRADPEYTALSKERWVARIRFDFDNRALGAADGDLKALIPLADRIEESWKNGLPDHAAVIFTRTARHLLPVSEDNASVAGQVIRFATNALNLIPVATPLPSQNVLTLLNLEIRFGSNTTKSVADLVDRELMLDHSLRVQQRLEEYLNIPLAEHTKPYNERLFPSEPSPPFRSPEANRALRENYDGFHRHDYQWKELTNTNRGPSRLESSKRELAQFVNKRFTTNAGDLQIIRRSLDRNITDPSLKDKLIRKIYRGQNPFLGLPVDLAPGSGGPSLAALTRKSAVAGHGAMASGGSHGASASASAPATGETPQSTSPRSLPYLPLAGVLGAGVVLWWFISRSRPG